MGDGKHVCARGEEKEGPLCPCPPSWPPVEALMLCGLLDSGNLQQSASVHFPSVHPHFPSSPPPPHPAPTPPVHTSTHPTHLHLAIQKRSLHHPLVHLTVHLSSVQRPGLACYRTQDVGSGSGLTADREVSVTGSMQAGAPCWKGLAPNVFIGSTSSCSRTPFPSVWLPQCLSCHLRAFPPSDDRLPR